jgi:hypothetical protein
VSIEKKVELALQGLDRGDLEEAASQLSIAVDATAKAKYQISKNRKRIALFLDESQPLLMHIASGGTIRMKPGARMRVTGTDLQSGKSWAKSYADLLYELVRCPLIHEAAAPPGVRFVRAIDDPGIIVSLNPDDFVVTDQLLLGLMLAVVGDKTNSQRRLQTPRTVRVYGWEIELNAVWGDAARIRHLVELGD